MAVTRDRGRTTRPMRLRDHPPRMGFFTDTWSASAARPARWRARSGTRVPEDGLDFTGMSYDNTGGLGADTWRHVAFIEQRKPVEPTRRRPGLAVRRRRVRTSALADVLRRVQALHARRLPRRLPDRRAVPHRVRHRRRAAGRLQRLRLLRARLPVRRHRPARGRRPGLEVHALLRPARRRPWNRPAPRPARPSRSSSATLDELRERAAARVEQLHDARRRPRPGCTAHDPDDGVGGDGAFFLLLDEPEVYGLPPDPVVTTRDLPSMWRHAGAAALPPAGVAAAVAARRRAGPAARRPAMSGRAASRPMVPDAEFTLLLRPADPQGSRPGRPPDIAGYLFLGGLAGASSVLAAGRRAHRPARRWPGPPRSAPLGAIAAVRWSRSSTTWAGPRGSSTCCGCSSRPRR